MSALMHCIATAMPACSVMAFLWSGDVYSTWETLKTHVPIAINTALTGIPFLGYGYWRLCSHQGIHCRALFALVSVCRVLPTVSCARTHLEIAPALGMEHRRSRSDRDRNYNGAAIPTRAELHNPQVEPICRKYLELRYRMLPYLYSAVRECTTTGMPIMRALWLHYPDDPNAVACGDQYLWGRNLLVAPVVEQGAESRRVYLPRGDWYDFWTGERSGRRPRDQPSCRSGNSAALRAGGFDSALGPVKQYTGENSDLPLSVSIYPGADASFLVYEDDGSSFNYRKGEWMGIQMEWNESRRTLALHLAPDSRMLPPSHRNFEVKLGETVRTLAFSGAPVEVKF